MVAIGLATIGNCAANAQLVGIDAAFATLLVGLVSTCNGLARVVVGMIYDRTNVKVTMFVDGAVAAVACGCIIGAFATGTPALYIAGALCCGFAYGGEPVVASAFARQRYGSAKYPLNLSVINTSIIYGSLLSMAARRWPAAWTARSPCSPSWACSRWWRWLTCCPSRKSGTPTCGQRARGSLRGECARCGVVHFRTVPSYRFLR